MPLVSILIPAFNAERWIAATLRSALAQTWPNKEIIVVDDGSTDSTLAIARSFEGRGVRVIAQANGGAAAARNEAFQRSSGAYIQWLDADDLFSPDKIERQMAVRGDGRTLMSCPWACFLQRPDRARFTPSPLWCDLTPVAWMTRKLAHNAYMPNATWLVSRELTESAGPWDTTLAFDDDGEYMCRVLLASVGVRFVPEGRVYYRESGGPQVSYIGRSEAKVRALWRSMRLHIRYIRSLDDGEGVRAACLIYLRNWLIHFVPDYPEIVREAEMLAAELGGDLGRPALSWKYSWVKSLFGWRAARELQMAARKVRWSVERRIDGALLRFGPPDASGCLISSEEL